MKTLIKLTVSIIAAFFATGLNMSAVSIVPQPQQMKETRSLVLIPEKFTIYAGDASLKDLAKTYVESLAKPYTPGTYELPNGFTRIVSDFTFPSIKVSGNAAKSFVKLALNKELAEEEYTMDVSVSGIEISGGSTKGVWWGLQTLSQIMLQANPAEGGIVTSGLHIQDKPHFGYRGAMLDCCRHFFPVEDVKKFIDMMAIHKLNVFHWHLTEDQGWRIEIKKYPLLTQIGSVRKETLIGHHRDSKEYDGKPYGGYYTQKDIKEIVDYATARQITIIPEIEMPGHAVAALASYPWLGCRGDKYEVRTTWGISQEVFCLGKETTYEFLKNVLDEVCELFPGEYIHIGGDEAPAIEWTKCPHCQALMKKEGLTEERQLQGYLIREIEPYLNAKGKKIIGWDEILEGGVTKTATIMSWRGPKGGIAAAKQGNHVVMSPNSNFYFDYYQTADPKANKEPLGIGGYVSLEKSYSFDPYAKLSESEKPYITGVQANTWAEYIADIEHVQHMDLPRFAALSEVGWSDLQQKSYEDFYRRVEATLLPAYQYFGFIYAPYVFNGIK